MFRWSYPPKLLDSLDGRYILARAWEARFGVYVVENSFHHSLHSFRFKSAGIRAVTIAASVGLSEELARRGRLAVSLASVLPATLTNVT